MSMQDSRHYNWYICVVYLIYLAHSTTVIGGHFHFFWLVYLWYMLCTTQSSVNVPSAKIPHLHLEGVVCGDVCQMYTRIWRLRRNLLIFIPRHMPHTSQVFGSQYSQVKLEGPLHIPGIYQSVIGLGYAGIRLVYYVGILCWSILLVYESS